jgi:enoyl-CoA hydratase/carnithine racemase
MEFKFIKYEKREHLAYITLNRPEVMNALHPPCHTEMDQVWDDFMADKDMWVAILTGAGERAFSAGNDLKWTAEHRGERPPMSKGGFAGITARFDITKPIIAAVNGFALGGGCEIALACDIIVAADHARFGLPEPRVGLMAGAGGVHRLPRHIPLKIAMGMILTGRHVLADEAHRWGLVNEVVPLKDLMAAAERWAGQIMECSPVSIQASKEAAMGGLGMSIEETSKHQFPGTSRLWKSKDVIEGPLAFAQKRKPQWKGE